MIAAMKPITVLFSRRFVLTALAAATVLAIVPARAHDYTFGALTVIQPWARATVGTARPGAVYVTLANRGIAADRLIGAESAASAQAELHRSTLAGGVMRMERVEAIEVPARGAVKIEPGGYHIMLIGLKAPLTAGVDLPLTLIFEKAGRLAVEAKIMALGGTAKDGVKDGAKDEAATAHGGH